MSAKASKHPMSILFEYSLFLIAGSVIALIWANVDAISHSHSYHDFIHHDLIAGFHHLKEGAHFNLHFVVNDIFMVFFFGIAMKEVTEAFLPGGALSSFSTAALPVVGTLGGVVGPVAVYLAGVYLFVHNPENQTTMAHGWAIPTATDIAYAWLFARIVFGAMHPAVTFLLVLAVLDDLIGMSIIAIFYSSNISAQWLGLLAAGMGISFALRMMKVKTFWAYVLLGGIPAWWGLFMTGVHASLALVFIVPFMPSHPHKADEKDELYSGEEYTKHHDTLNSFEHFFKSPVDIGLFFFGLANAGVPAQAFGTGTVITIAAIIVGKTLGIFLFALIGNKVFRLSMPPHTGLKEVFTLGMVAAIGFTVAIFVTTVAFGNPPEGISKILATQYMDEIKMGALLSFASGFIAIILGKALGIKKIQEQTAAE